MTEQSLILFLDALASLETTQVSESVSEPQFHQSHKSAGCKSSQVIRSDIHSDIRSNQNHATQANYLFVKVDEK